MSNRKHIYRIAPAVLLVVAAVSCAGHPSSATPDAAGLTAAALAAYSPTPSATFTITPTSTPSPTVTSTPIPRLIAKAVYAGEESTCAITTSGGAKCWGWNGAGNLGDGTNQDRYTPVDVIGLSSGVKQISMGKSYACALTTAGTVKCWGKNGYLGGDDNFYGLNSAVPVDVPKLSGEVTAISSGSESTYMLMASGDLQCWGSCSEFTGSPVKVYGLPPGIVGVSAGGSHACVLLNTKEVMCWGSNTDGEVGIKGAGDFINKPTKIDGLSIGVVAISAGATHTCVLLRTGEVMCWGRWMNRGLKTEREDKHPIPIVIIGLGGPAAAVSAGNNLTCALMTNGCVKCWGRRMYEPLDNPGLESDATALSTGSTHLCAIMTDGVVKCFGYNYYGKLGDGTTINPDSSVEVICPDC